MSQVQTQTFSLSVVLPIKKASPPTAAQLKMLQHSSNVYLLKNLVNVFANVQDVNLTFGSLEIKTRKAELSSRFDVYWEGQATVTFDTADDSSNTSIPLAHQVSARVLAILGTKEYLTKIVRDEMYQTPFGQATEMQLPRMVGTNAPMSPTLKKSPPRRPSGAVPRLVQTGEGSGKETVIVRTSSMRMAFRQEAHYEDDEPTKENYELLALSTEEYYANYLAKVFPQTFVDISVKVGDTAFGLNNPSDKYHIYLGWNITATFQADSALLEKYSKGNRHEILPNDYYLCRYLTNALGNDFLSDYVWVLENTPFVHSCAVFTEQVMNNDNGDKDNKKKIRKHQYS